MKKVVIFCYMCVIGIFCRAQSLPSLSTYSSNDTASCYMLVRDFISDIQINYIPGPSHYKVDVFLTSNGVEEVSSLTSNIQFIKLDSSSIKIPIFSRLESVFPKEPHIYGYVNNHFILENNSFSICFHKSFLSQCPNFIEQLHKLINIK